MRDSEGASQDKGEQEDDESDDGPSSLETMKLVLETVLAVARLLGSL